MKQVNNNNAAVSCSRNSVQELFTKSFQRKNNKNCFSDIHTLLKDVQGHLLYFPHTLNDFSDIWYSTKQLYISPLGSCQLFIGANLLCYTI
jgi:hypothetical protein